MITIATSNFSPAIHSRGFFSPAIHRAGPHFEFDASTQKYAKQTQFRIPARRESAMNPRQSEQIGPRHARIFPKNSTFFHIFPKISKNFSLFPQPNLSRRSFSEDGNGLYRPDYHKFTPFSAKQTQFRILDPSKTKI